MENHVHRIKRLGLSVVISETWYKSRNRDAILAGARCVYCANKPIQLEHMPPLTMFKHRWRPSGMEFAACGDCNNGTRAADVVAGFMARIGRSNGAGDWQIIEAAAQKTMISKRAPGLLEELFGPGKTKKIWLRGPSGLVEEKVQLSADGPLLNAYLTVFAAKMGMALYREHCGAALPPEGGVQTQYFLNAGLTQRDAEVMLRILPGAGTLKQGKVHVGEQFGYKYNCDDQSIVAALIGFHSNLRLHHRYLDALALRTTKQHSA